MTEMGLIMRMRRSRMISMRILSFGCGGSRVYVLFLPFSELSGDYGNRTLIYGPSMSFIYIKIKLIEYDYKLLYSEWPKTPIVAIIITASQAQYFQNIGPRNVDTFCTATTARVNLISIVSPAYSS